MRANSPIGRRAFLGGGVALAGGTLLSRGRARAAVADLDFADARAVALAIRSGQVSSVEVVTRSLGRIKRYNPALNAIVTLTDAAALERAKAADEARARGEWWGPLHGVPITIKDTYEVAGVRTTAGAPPFASHVPKADAVVAA